jgi:E3 ubiquitin-protein ligase SHPRH
VTCASRVFLLESVVHHAFEVQGRRACSNLDHALAFTGTLTAIARIDRMGQTRPTEGSFVGFLGIL